jgi:hypothetical protein
VTIPMALARRTGSSDRGCRNGNGLDGVDELPERCAERIVERSVDLEGVGDVGEDALARRDDDLVRGGWETCGGAGDGVDAVRSPVSAVTATR